MTVLEDSPLDRPFPGMPFVESDVWGNCMVCGHYQDLRYETCFDCADYVVTNGAEAWDIRHPDRRWLVVTV